MLLQNLTELCRRLLGEVVNSGGDRALVGKESRDSSFVFGASLADERRVVQKSIFRGIALGLQRSKKSLLGTENLDSRGRVFREVGQASGMRD